MPIFKRYYIADIPGFGWLAQFYVTHLYSLPGRNFNPGAGGLYDHRLPDFAKKTPAVDRLRLRQRRTILAGILVSGLLLVIRNLSGSRFAPEFIIFLDLAHLGLVMSFLTDSRYTVWLEKDAGLHSDKLKSEIWNLKNSGQMPVKILLIYEEHDYERHFYCIGYCGSLVFSCRPIFCLNWAYRPD